MLNLISFSPLPRLRVQIGLPDWFYSSRDGSAQVLLRILFCRFLESMLLPVDLTHWLVYGLVIWGNYSPSWSVLNQKIVCLSVCWFEWMIEMLRIYIYIYFNSRWWWACDPYLGLGHLRPYSIFSSERSNPTW